MYPSLKRLNGSSRECRISSKLSWKFLAVAELWTSSIVWRTWWASSGSDWGTAYSVISVTPRTLNISTEWWAVMARPHSVTIVGCGTSAVLQASAMAATTSDTYSYIV